MLFRSPFRHTTIGDVAFHFRVRDGTGWYHDSKVTRPLFRSGLFPLPEKDVFRPCLIFCQRTRGVPWQLRSDRSTSVSRRWKLFQRLLANQKLSQLSAGGPVPLEKPDRIAENPEIKPIGKLVSLSSTRYRASTCDLSTWWSTTSLMGKCHLRMGLALRCFQRLSLPYIATRRCRRRDNRNTRGTSFPVLSY